MRAFTCLSTALIGDDPPTEFRVFSAGKVDTTHGVFIFDESSIQSVMSEYSKHGVDLMVDYSHASLTESNADPAMTGRAAGWFRLEVRDGELWAVDVKWSGPASDALRNKEWRYISPAFNTKDGRITSLVNVAITNLPATRKALPLVAASQSGEHTMLELLKKAADAIAAGDLDTASALLIEAMAAAEESAPASEEAPVEASEDGEEEIAASEEEQVAASKIVKMTGVVSLSAALQVIEAFKASHLELETERQKLAAEQAKLDAAERRRGCIELVTLGKRAPATVWADSKCSKPKKYLETMSIEDFREYVADAKASVSASSKPTPKTAKTSEHGLDARELQICSDTGCDPKTFAMLRSRREA